MADKNANKVIYGNTVLIDLTADTVTADKILASYTAHDASGAMITGTCDFDVNSQDATVQVAEILSGSTAYARGTKLTGTMPNNGGVDLSILQSMTKWQLLRGIMTEAEKLESSILKKLNLLLPTLNRE